MASAVERMSEQVGEIYDDRKPKSKSPVIVQLVWDGETALEPGATVELGAAVFDPTTSDSAPFSGLIFNCTAFSGAAELSDYAITMGPISSGGGVGYGIMPEAYWAKVDVTDEAHTNAIIDAAGTLLASAESGGLRIVWKPSGTGEKWCVVSLMGGSSDSQPPLRAFELTANKNLASATATAKWLDIDGNLIGDDVTLHDPEHRFSGRIEDDLYSGSNGFRGYALLRTDLASEEPDQWDIVEMDSLYEFIKAEIVKVSNYPSVGVTTVARYQEEINQHGYDRHPPASANSEVGYELDTEIFDEDDYLTDPDDSEPGESTAKPVLMQLTDPDTEPPTYRVCEVKPAASSGGGSPLMGRVKSATGCGYVIKKCGPTGTCDSSIGLYLHALNAHEEYITLPTDRLVIIVGEPASWTEYADLTAANAAMPVSCSELPYAMLVNPVDFLAELTGMAANKVLYTDGADPEDIQWGGSECVPPE